MDLALPWSPPDLETSEKLPYEALHGLGGAYKALKVAFRGLGRHIEARA